MFRRIRRIAVAAATIAAAALLAASPRPAAAGSASSTLTVSAHVLDACTISAASLNFGDYDPTAAADLEPAPSNITVQCTNGSTFTIDLGLGSHATGTTRQMSGGAAGSTALLRYELFEDAARTTAWATGTQTHTANTAGAGLSSYTVPVYGRIPAGQIVSTGNYTDSVTMTVQF